MNSQEDILEKLTRIEELLTGQSLLQKEVLSFKEACQYLEMSESHLYKLTSNRQIPHFCPNGKKLYFNRQEINQWLQRKRLATNEQMDEQALKYLNWQKNKTFCSKL